MIVVCDSREQRPWQFTRWPDIEVRSGTLDAGDYSLSGLETVVAVERKSLPDLVCCLAAERPRSERELARLKGMDFAAVVIEGDWRDLAAGNYRSKLNLRAAVASIAAFSVRYVPFLFAGDRDGAELLALELLSNFARELSRRYEAARQALAMSPE